MQRHLSISLLYRTKASNFTFAVSCKASLQVCCIAQRLKSSRLLHRAKPSVFKLSGLSHLSFLCGCVLLSEPDSWSSGPLWLCLNGIWFFVKSTRDLVGAFVIWAYLDFCGLQLACVQYAVFNHWKYALFKFILDILSSKWQRVCFRSIFIV